MNSTLQNDFLNMLVKHWDNFQQAQSSPSHFAHIHYLWYWEDGFLRSKQWYDWSGEVYRERVHRYRTEEDTFILDTFRLDGTQEPTIYFTRSEDGFEGSPAEGATNSRGELVESQINVTPDSFVTVDKGNKGEAWGDNPGAYVFKPK